MLHLRPITASGGKQPLLKQHFYIPAARNRLNDDGYPPLCFPFFSSSRSLLIRTLMESRMTSAAKHLPPEYSVSTSLCLLRLGGLEKIALCTAGDIITFIACGRADLFPLPGERERGLLPHTPTFSASLWADGLETVFLFFTHHSLFFFFFFSGGDATSEAVRCGRVSAGAEGMEKKKRLICEVTLFTWPPSKTLSVAKRIEARARARARGF